MPEELLERPVETQIIGQIFFRLEHPFFILGQSFWDRAGKDSRDDRASYWSRLESFHGRGILVLPNPSSKGSHRLCAIRTDPVAGPTSSATIRAA